jgi:hypothetical protein
MKRKVWIEIDEQEWNLFRASAVKIGTSAAALLGRTVKQWNEMLTQIPPEALAGIEQRWEEVDQIKAGTLEDVQKRRDDLDHHSMRLLGNAPDSRIPALAEAGGRDGPEAICKNCQRPITQVTRTYNNEIPSVYWVHDSFYGPGDQDGIYCDTSHTTHAERQPVEHFGEAHLEIQLDPSGEDGSAGAGLPSSPEAVDILSGENVYNVEIVPGEEDVEVDPQLDGSTAPAAARPEGSSSAETVEVIETRESPYKPGFGPTVTFDAREADENDLPPSDPMPLAENCPDVGSHWRLAKGGQCRVCGGTA